MDQIEDKTKIILNFMSEVQSRRWQMRLNGLNLRQIAKKEGVSYQAVQNSLELGQRKVKKISKIIQGIKVVDGLCKYL